MTRGTWRRRPRRTWPPAGIADTGVLRPRGRVLRLRLRPLRHQRERVLLLHRLESRAAWNTGSAEEGGNRGYKVRYKGGYFPVPPVDHYADLRDEIVAGAGAARPHRSSAQHHEVGTAGQAEINYKFSTLLHAARRPPAVQVHREEHRLARTGKTATFMPKPLFGDNGSGMHVHQRLWLGGEPLFYDETGYAGLSDTAR